jgi:hypothetical protein
LAFAFALPVWSELPGESAGMDVVVTGACWVSAAAFGALLPLFAVLLLGALVVVTGAGSGATAGEGADVWLAASFVLTVVVGAAGAVVSGAGVDAGGGVAVCVVVV